MSETSPGFYGRLAAAVMDHPRTTLALLALMSALAVLLMFRIQMDPDMSHLLPANDPTTQAIQALQKEDGAVNLLTIAVKGHDPAAVNSFLIALQGKLDAMPEVDFTLYKLDPTLSFKLGLLNLPLDDLTRLRDRLTGALALGPAIQNPFVAGQWLDLGALTERLKERADVSPLSSPGGVSRILIRPKEPATNSAFSKKLMAEVYATLDALKPEARGVSVEWIGGAYRHNVEDLQSIAYDLERTNTASLVMVLALVLMAYRKLRAVLLIFAPILLGNLWALGYAGASVRTLTSFTCFFSAIIVGLGIEFSIHLYSRYREERTHLHDTRLAVIRAWDLVGPPSMTSAMCSSGAFLALWVARFQGFQQLGTLLAGGNMLCLIAVLISLPLLIYWLERKDVLPAPAAHEVKHRSHKHRLPAMYRLAPLMLALLALITVATAFMLPRIPFQFDVSELRRQGLAYRDLGEEQKELAEDSYTPVIVSYPDDASMTADHLRLTAMMANGGLPEIRRILDLRSVLPADQEARMAILRALAVMSHNPNAVYLPAVVQQNLARIAGLDLATMSGADLPHPLQALLGASGGHHWVVLLPSGNMWDLRETARLYDALHKAIPDRPLAGQYLALSVLYRLVRDDAPRVAMVALLIVFLTTALDLRNIRRALGAIGALVAGICWAGAGMALFQVKLSMVNFVGIPILMGIAVDAIIHLQHRLSEEGPGRINKAMVTTGVAVALGALTNAFSFASLVFATTEGVRSLGFLVVIGLTLVTLAAFVLVPLGWMTSWRLGGELPGVPPEE